MFEFIGIVVVAFVVLLFVKSFLRAKSTIRSREFGKEARHIAVNELRIPDKYFSHAVQTKMGRIKNHALHLQQVSQYSKFSWPRLLAWGVFMEFRGDCANSMVIGSEAREIFSRLGISDEDVVEWAAHDPEAALND